jgi:predicted ester cyclase
VSSAEDNKALVRRFLEELVRGNLYIIDELLSPDFVDRSLMPGQGPTREDFKRSVAEILEGWTTTAFAIEEQVAEGDTVVTRVSESGVQRGELAGLARAGLEDTTKIIYMHHISGGKIAEEWSTQEPRPLWENLTQQLRERERVEQELQVARRIQHASLPEDLPALEGWQISPFYQPAREVGGDFYDLFELQDGRLGIVVGDATGHGVPAALVMASARSMLRAVAQASDTPGDVLSRVNDPLATDIPSNMFVTCFYAILDPESGSLSYANAGHDLPYLRRHSGECEELRARGMPLGIMPGMSYEQKEVVLEGGEAALFYSDGLVEAHDPEGEMFGFPRLQALVAEHGEENSLEERLLEELYSFVGEGWEQEDDITLLTLRRSAP